MFRLVNSTKNIKNTPSRTILTSIPISRSGNYFTQTHIEESLYSNYDCRKQIPYKREQSPYQREQSPCQRERILGKREQIPGEREQIPDERERISVEREQIPT